MTSITKPQVELTVDGIEGSCANLNCDYEYTTPAGEITSQSVSGLSVSVSGTSLPTTGVSVVFGGAPCSSSSISAQTTSLTCTLEHEPYGGIGLNVEVYDENGLIPIGTGASGIDISVTVSGISPSTDLNQLGGNTLTITGTGFPSVASYVEV